MILRESCVESLNDALLAEFNGVERIEFCDNLFVGGTSVSYGVIKSVLQNLKIPVLFMIRPRGGNFVYSEAEFESMKADVEICRQLGCYGVVAGILLENGNVDMARTKDLVDLAGGMHFTFHKAFDRCPDVKQALEDVISTGVGRLLTSGQADTAENGMDCLNDIYTQANGRIKIVAAGKVTSENLIALSAKTDIHEFHGKRIVNF
jgi:copper homeostasis protein